MINLKRMEWDVQFRGCPDPVAHTRAIRAYFHYIGYQSREVPGDLRDCQAWHPHHCRQCNRRMNPVDYIVGPVCLDCCKANQKAAAGRV